MSIKRINSRTFDEIAVGKTEVLRHANFKKDLDKSFKNPGTYQLGIRFESAQIPVLQEFVDEEKRESRLQEEKLKKIEAEKFRILRERAAKLEALQKKVAEEKAALEKEKQRIAEQKRKEIEKQNLALRMARQAQILEKQRAQKAMQETEEERVRKEKERLMQERETQLMAWREAQREQERIQWAQQEAAEQLKLNVQANRKKSKSANKKGNFTFKFGDFWENSSFAFGFNLRKVSWSFALAAFFLVLGIGGISYAQKGLAIKGKVLGISQDGYQNLTNAVGAMTNQDFGGSAKDFAAAYDSFSQASTDLDSLGSVFVQSSRFVPFASKLSSGKNVTEAGKHIAGAGKALNEIAQTMAALKNPLNQNERSTVSLLDVFNSTQEKIKLAKEELTLAKDNIEKVNVDDLPQEKQSKFLLLKEKLPAILATFDEFLNNNYIITDLLGGNGPRKYLFLFQNNTEMRATGGFVGSYGLLDISQGHVRNFFVDGIFNPDGQLKAKIIPPGPIQKISAAWSLHDSNWFPNFPTSARKAISFYEKTGGPTVDGVITLTPTVMEKLLAVTGPIEMPEYEVTLTQENFIEKTQQEVEVDYDKQENKPKKILADLAPILMERIVSAKDMRTLKGAAMVFAEGLKEKHILLYSENKDLQEIIERQGWSGEILPTNKDYLSVINTNINGYKTDAVVEEKIQHQSEIASDGSIVDTVTITRKHNGGDTAYEWWNKVNADYLRVYVPRGAKLLEVSGQTRELDKTPLDYAALGFNKDVDVEREEASMTIDEETGTRIYEDADKTVFANWTYVSPGETMTLIYRYQLPFRLFQVLTQENEQADSYSLVVQKQAGSVGSEFSSVVNFPATYEPRWIYPENEKNEGSKLETKADLATDQFVGIVFEKKD